MDVDLGGCIAVSIFCDLPLPLSPFKAPPQYGCMSWFGVYWGARQRVPLLLAFHFLVGIATLGGTEIFLLRVNEGVHRGKNSGLGIPTCCLSHPIAML